MARDGWYWHESRDHRPSCPRYITTKLYDCDLLQLVQQAAGGHALRVIADALFEHHGLYASCSIDRETARRNEEGENAHKYYKNRQRSIVAKRLKKGGRWRRHQQDGD